MKFLNPESDSHFKHALNYYQEGTSEKRIKSAESIRRSLEEFLRFKLKNSKGLTENITEFQKILKADSRSPQIRNIIFQIFNYLDQYYNENSKHNDGEINEEENEFLIYQTGILMRYIDKVIK